MQKKILHILTLSRRAGVELMFINYLNYMKQTNPESLKKQIIFAISLSPHFKETLDKLGVKYYVETIEESSKMARIVKRISNLKKIIKENNIDLVYGQNFKGNYYSALARISNKNIKVICHEHGTAWTNNFITTIITLFWTKMADKIICNSYAAKTMLVKKFRANKKKIKVVYNGVPYKKLIKVKKYDYHILFVGRLDYVKSPETIIKAIPFIIKEIPDIKLNILGEGNLLNNLREIVSQNKLQDKVVFRGNVENVNDYMAKASLLVVPSIREAFGNVIIEAAYQETPTIGTNVDGIAEVIINKETGILLDASINLKNKKAPKFVVDPQTNNLVNPKQINPQSLANEIVTLLKGGNIKKMGVKARNHVISKFSFENYYNNIKNELDELN